METRMTTSASSRIARLHKLALDVLFPARCTGCGSEGAFLCAKCLGKQRRLDQPYYPANVGGPNACLVTSLSLSGVLSCFAMEGAVRQAVHDLKYNGVQAMAPFLADFLARRALDCGMKFDAVVPVPLHRNRQWERGYNQAELLARPVAVRLGLPLMSEAISRTKATPPLAQSRALQDRISSVRGAFGSPGGLDGKRILLVDDVCTSGATLDACAQALADGGAWYIWGLTLAREV